MLRRSATSLALVLILSPGLFAQRVQEPIEPKTKLGQFGSQAGVVVIRGFSTIGSLKGLYGTVVEVECKEFSSPATGKREYGITIEVKETGTRENENSSFVDYDEIDALIAGIDYIAKVDKTATKLDSFQADYRTKDDLQISTFSNNNEIKVAVSSGYIGKTTAYFGIAEISKLRDLVTAAKAKLDLIRAAG
jgi:hypothetical protein